MSTDYSTIPFVKEQKLKVFSRAEVAKHNKESDIYVVIDTFVWDMSKFVDMHPGGAHVLLAVDVAGKDGKYLLFSRNELPKKKSKCF